MEINADQPHQGMIFDTWTGDTDIIIDPNQKDMEVKTKKGNATLTATYKQATFQLRIGTIDSRMRGVVPEEEHQKALERRRKKQKDNFPMMGPCVPDAVLKLMNKREGLEEELTKGEDSGR